MDKLSFPKKNRCLAASVFHALAFFSLVEGLRQLLRFYRVLCIYTSLEWRGGIPIKKVLISLCIVTLTIVSGCLNHPSMTQFTGESKTWSASYTITKLNREDHMERFQIRYKGKDPANVGRVNYKFTGTTMSGSGEQKLSGNRDIVTGSGGNGAIPPEDSTIQVTVEWKGHKEEMELSTSASRK